MRKLLLALCLIPSLAWAQQPIVFPGPTAPYQIPLTQGISGTGVSLTVILSGNITTYDYICGFVATSAGTSTVTVANLTVTGVKSPQLFIYDYPNPGQGVLGVAFPGCLTSATKGTGITITLGAGDAASQTSLSAWGYAN